MEQHKTSKQLNNSTASKFATKKWIEVNDLCNYSDVYIVVKGGITLEGRDMNKLNK